MKSINIYNIQNMYNISIYVEKKYIYIYYIKLISTCKSTI